MAWKFPGLVNGNKTLRDVSWAASQIAKGGVSETKKLLSRARIPSFSEIKSTVGMKRSKPKVEKKGPGGEVYAAAKKRKQMMEDISKY